MFGRAATLKAVGAGAAMALGLMAFVYWALVVQGMESPIALFRTWEDYVAVAIILALMPYAALDLLRAVWTRSVERNMPRLLADVEGLIEGGLSPVMALRQVGVKAYGVLGREVRRVVTLVSWGYPYARVKEMIEERVPHAGASLSLKLLLDAEEGGGDVRSAIRSLREYVRETLALKGEIYSNIRLQVLIIYLALIVFLYISDTILSTFITSVVAAGEVPGMTGGRIDVGLVRRLFFHMYLAEAILGGFAIGKVSTGSIGPGVKHVLVLTLIGLFYNLFIASGGG